MSAPVSPVPGDPYDQSVNDFREAVAASPQASESRVAFGEGVDFAEALAAAQAASFPPEPGPPVS
jgi:hypothetical protein